MMNKPCQILLVDDHTLFREALCRVIKTIPGAKKITEAANGREALNLVRTHNWDLVLLDIEMPEMDGIEALRKMSKQKNPPPVIIVTMHKREDMVELAYSLGAKGYLLKDSDTAELKLAIETVLNGGIHFTAQVQKVLFNNVAQRDVLRSDEPRLTPKELNVLRLICEEKSGKEIAEILSIALPTVNTYRRALLQKTRCINMAGLVRYAYDRGLNRK